MLLAARDEDGAALSDVQVRDEIMTLFAAGHETTANSLTWTLYLLSQHAEERDKLLVELQSVLQGRAPTVEDLRLLPATIMQRYSPALVPGHRVEPRPMVTLHAKFGMQMVLVPTKKMAVVG